MAKPKTETPALFSLRGRPKGVAEPLGRARRNGTLQDKLDHWTIPEPNSGCLLWFGPVNRQGYPNISFKGRTRRGNRLVWQQRKGPIPPGLHVLHKCDVTCCVEENHLFLGTNAQNVADKITKGRQRNVRGNDHPNMKIPDELVPSIRADKRSHQDIADDYGVTRQLIRWIQERKGRRHVP